MCLDFPLFTVLGIGPGQICHGVADCGAPAVARGVRVETMFATKLRASDIASKSLSARFRAPTLSRASIERSRARVMIAWAIAPTSS